MTKSIDFKGEPEDAQDVKSCAFMPRLLNLHDAARYIGISPWTLRDYVADGLIPRVALPCSRRRKKGGAVVRRAGDIEARRIYVDRADLDRLIERSKHDHTIV
jgi:predicted site-specific integrase-resolvase